MKHSCLLRFYSTALLSILFMSVNTMPASAEGAESEAGLVTSAEGEGEIFLTKPPSGSAAEWKRVRYQEADYYSKSAAAGDRVPTGAIIHTKSNGKIRFVYSDGDQLNVGPSTSMKIEDRSIEGKRRRTVLNVLYGRTRAVVKKQENRTDESAFIVRTKAAVAGVRGTDFTVNYSPTDGQAEVSVLRGAVELSLEGSKAKAEVKSGYSATVKTPVAVATPSPAQKSPQTTDASTPATTPTEAKAVTSPFELKKTTKEELATILVFSHVQPKEDPAKALPSPVAEEIKKAEQTATAAVLEDIKAVDPNLHAKLTAQTGGAASTANDLNSVVVGEQIQKAPGEAPKQKKLQKEFKEFDEKIYKKYFDVQ